MGGTSEKVERRVVIVAKNDQSTLYSCLKVAIMKPNEIIKREKGNKKEKKSGWISLTLYIHYTHV